MSVRDGTGSGFLTRDPTRPDPVVERCETIINNGLKAVSISWQETQIV